MSLNIADIEKTIKEHMENQPYKCMCADCGAKVDADVTIDGDLDMIIIVPVCECAQKEGDA